VEPRPTTRTNLTWAASFVAGILFLLSVAVAVGIALSTLSLLRGSVVAFVLLVLVAGVLAPVLRSLSARLPR
jgi:hypothetical protein